MPCSTHVASSRHATPIYVARRMIALVSLAVASSAALATANDEPPAPVARVLTWRDAGVRLPLPWTWRVEGVEDGAWRIYSPLASEPVFSIAITVGGLDRIAGLDRRFTLDKGVWYFQDGAHRFGRVEATPISGRNWTGIYAEQTCMASSEVAPDAEAKTCLTAYASDGRWIASLKTSGFIDAQAILRDVMPVLQIGLANELAPSEWPPLALAASLVRMGVPEDASLGVWTDVPDRSLAAWVRPDAADNAMLDLNVVVLASDSGRLVARTTHAFPADDALRFEGLSLEAVDFALAPGKPSFAIDFSRRHSGCAASELKSQSLFELDGSEVRLLLDEATLQAHTAFCDGDETTDSIATIELAKRSHAGHADLVLDEQFTETRCDGKGRCRELRPKHSRHVLRFDGQRYVQEPAKPGR